MDIANWLILGLLVACCVVPMLLMGRRGKTRGDAGKKPPSAGSGRPGW